MQLGIIIKFVYNRTAKPKCSNLCNAFYGRQFREPSRVQGWLCTKAISRKKRVDTDIAMTIWRFWLSDCKYVLLLVQVRVLRVTRRVCVWGNRVTSQQSIQPIRNGLNCGLCTANTYEHHHCVCHATLFPFRAWTDKTNLKAEARDYGKERYISDACLWCLANHKRHVW